MKTVAIVGAHQDTRALAPYGEPEVEIWVFNESAMFDWCPRASAVFQPHLPTVYKNPLNRANVDYAEWLRQEHEFPIYLIDVDPDVPASVRYPLDEIVAALPCEPRMFTSAATYALAYAAYTRPDKVLFYGVEASFYAEYKQQREALAYWVGFLQGSGIVVERHCADGIFVNPLYGRENVWYQEPEDYLRRMVELENEVTGTRMKMSLAPHGSKNFMDALVAHAVAEGKLEERKRYYEKVKAMRESTGEAILDRTEMERAAKDLLPQIDAERMAAQAALGSRQPMLYRRHYTEAARLAGRWQENIDMVKAAPSAVSYEAQL